MPQKEKLGVLSCNHTRNSNPDQQNSEQRALVQRLCQKIRLILAKIFLKLVVTTGSMHETVHLLRQRCKHSWMYATTGFLEPSCTWIHKELKCLKSLLYPTEVCGHKAMHVHEDIRQSKLHSMAHSRPCLWRLVSQQHLCVRRCIRFTMISSKLWDISKLWDVSRFRTCVVFGNMSCGKIFKSLLYATEVRADKDSKTTK